MNKILLVLTVITFVLNGYSQQITDEKTKATFTSSAIYYAETEALRDLSPIRMDWPMGLAPTIHNNLRRNEYVNRANAFPKGNDPVWQKEDASHSSKAPLQNWLGTTTNSSPPDPSGAVGPNHYVQMVNLEFTIFDKVGNILYGPSTLGSLLGGGNDGDPIVMYDNNADRWFLSQFKQSNNSLQIAVSQTGDPTGSYYTYEFPLGTAFPDYPKYSVWGDSYMVTSNKSGEQCYAMERNKMLAGDPNAQIVGFVIPQLVDGGFFSVIPAHASNGTVTSGTPNYLYYFQDDAWGGVAQDHIKIWEVNVDWLNTANSTISAPQELVVSPFDSEFDPNWNDIEQPGTPSKLDGIPGAFMYMAQYREFPSYHSIVLNHTVDVNATNHAGIRWYELRKSGNNPWSLYQEGTFAPDGESRWLGSICMDQQGNIGLAYSVSGPTVYPSIRYTGRNYYDPLGQMTLTEESIVAGTSVQTGNNRYGDYAQMTIDPADDNTFWYTGEYIDNGKKTRIASFSIGSQLNDDIGVVSVDAPMSGILSNAESVTVTVKNFGVNSASNFPIGLIVNGNTPINETYTGSLIAGQTAQYTFTQTADMSAFGDYYVKAFTAYSIDEYVGNDSAFYTVTHPFDNDIGVSAITAPISGTGMGSATENVSIIIENYGTLDQSNFPVSYIVNGGAPVTETYTGTITAGSNTAYTFTTTANLSSLGTYDFVSYTGLSGDAYNVNDTTSRSVILEMCSPNSDCSFAGNISMVQFGSINNSSSCSLDGYGDYTAVSTNLEQGVSYNLLLQTDGLAFGAYTATAWIDFNDNFSFESNEIIVQDMIYSAAVDTALIDIPSNAALGQHLMRIKGHWDFTPANVTDPCGDMSYGETEDYTVDVIAFTGIDRKYKNLELVVGTMDNGKFNIQMEGVKEPVSVLVHNSIGQKVFSQANIQTGSSLNYTLDLSGNAEGYYLIKVSNENFSKVKKVAIK